METTQQNTTGTLGEALVKAGVRTPAQRLTALAREAVKKAKSIDDARDRLNQSLLDEDDAKIERELCAPARPQCVDRLLSATFSVLRAEGFKFPRAPQAATQPSGQHDRETQSTTAARAAGQSSGHTARETQADAAARPAAPQQPSRRTGEAMDAVGEVSRHSYLNSFRINRRPIGECTVEEAREWAASHQRDAHFVFLLIHGLPAQARIRDFRTAEEAAKFYKLALELPRG
jgi:hypothetical protein